MKWILVLALCASAFADTGGRMGGGSWGNKNTSTPTSRPTPSSGGGSFGGGSHWTDHSSSSSHDDFWKSSPKPASDPFAHSNSSSSSSSSSGGRYVSSDSSYEENPTVELIFKIVIGVAVLGVAFVAFRMFFFPNSGNTSSFTPMVSKRIEAADPNLIDVSVLRVVIDGRARKFVQTELAKIAKDADTSTDTGRVAMLREVTLMLRRLRDAWVYGGAVNEAQGSMNREKPVFDHHVDEARLRFREETVSNEQGVKSGAQAGTYTPRSDEGAGVILVSIILAARGELFTVTEIGSGNDLRSALEAAGTLDENSLIAVEVVWQPSEDADRLSSLELEAKYPRPMLIPLRDALVGKMFCAYCSGPFPAELVSCPHCGAPAHPKAA